MNTSFFGKRWHLVKITNEIVLGSSLNKQIKYIGFYDRPDSLYKRASALSATNKMDYICDALHTLGFAVHIISPSWIVEANNSWQRQRTTVVSTCKKLTLCPSFGSTSRLALYFKIIISLTWLFCYLVITCKKNETILAYHTPWLSLPLRMAKAVKGFRLILEVEEIYADVSLLHPYFDVMEKRLLRSADSYLLSTYLLKNKVDDSKRYAIIHGVYTVSEVLSTPFNDGKVHLLYAGIIDSHKQGAFNAVECSQYLSEQYVLHVIGFGETDKLCARIDELNRTNKCQIYFDGTKSGEEYVRYCQMCHIGLSTQKMVGEYLQTSFPSKILSYLSMGLNVVSCYVECVAESKIGSLVTYYHDDDPKEIARAVMSVPLRRGSDLQKAIAKLHQSFMDELKVIVADT